MTEEAYVSIKQIKLSNFRNYQCNEFNFDRRIIAIFGSNGVGKTNLLEAITLISKGQGLKNAPFEEIINNKKSAESFTIYCKLQNHPEIENIGTTYSALEGKRTFQINHKLLNSNSKNKTFPSIIWLTPQMDNLFCSSKSLRRRFLDKIASDIDINHNTRLNLYNQSLRERINLLNRSEFEHKNWLDIVELKIAELATAIATSRNEAVNYLNKIILQNDNNFGKATLKIIGATEEWAQNHKAIEVEQLFIEKLFTNRKLDQKSNRTNFGVHRSDFSAVLIEKQIEAKFCSTGEQKSILINLTFARVKIFPLLNLPSAILLLDEIISHLDDKKKSLLLKEISILNCQSFISATSNNLLVDLDNFKKDNTQFLEIT